MSNSANPVKQQYQQSALYDTIVDRLKQQGKELENIQRSDIGMIDEFHVRGAAVSLELIASLDVKPKKVLDVGCGIGGPCRLLAEEFDCEVTGIDLSPDFIDTAKKLSQLVKMEHKTHFMVGDATALPFENSAYDLVWTQHVQMNIADKSKFYDEIYRVLKKSGRFIYYDIFKKGNDPISFPVPWANEENISHLFSTQEFKRITNDLEFHHLEHKDQTAAGIEFFEKLLQKIKVDGPPAIGLNLLMGSSTFEKLSNLLTALKEGNLELQSGILRK